MYKIFPNYFVLFRFFLFSVRRNEYAVWVHYSKRRSQDLKESDENGDAIGLLHSLFHRSVILLEVNQLSFQRKLGP